MVVYDEEEGGDEKRNDLEDESVGGRNETVSKRRNVRNIPRAVAAMPPHPLRNRPRGVSIRDESRSSIHGRARTTASSLFSPVPRYRVSVNSDNETQKITIRLYRITCARVCIKAVLIRLSVSTKLVVFGRLPVNTEIRPVRPGIKQFSVFALAYTANVLFSQSYVTYTRPANSRRISIRR